MEACILNYKISLPRIRSSSCSTNNNRTSSIKFSTYKSHDGYSKIFSNNPLAWSNDFYTRKNYMGVMLVRQSNNNNNNNNNVQSSSAVTPGPPPGKPWSKWLVGVILSLVLPLVSNKWGRLLAIKSQVCAVVNSVETVAETVEKFAEEVAHAADEVASNLPKGGTMQKIACNIAHVAEETAKDAHLVDQFIEKVEDVENEIVSSIVGGVNKKATHEIEVDEITQNSNKQSHEELEQKDEISTVVAHDEVPQNFIDQPKE